MTRYARKGPANKKKPLPASDWTEMMPREKSKTDESADTSGSMETGKISETEPKTLIDKNCVQAEERKRKRKNSDCESDIKKSKKLKSLHLDLATTLEKRDMESLLEEEQTKDEGEVALEVLVRKVSRGEQRRLKRIEQRQKEKVCLSCRRPGHQLIDCPDVEKNGQCLDICYRCGSGEHKITQCKAKKVPHGQFPFANCFICGERGHISRDCPENRNGLYPNGGCCLVCGSIYHFKRDCPDLTKNKGLGLMSLKTADKCRSLDEDPTVQPSKEIEKKDNTHNTHKKLQKIVKF